MTSPRSVRACKSLGVNQELELMNKTTRDFLDKKEARRDKDLARELARMELQNYEKVRDNLLEQIRKKRAVIIHLEESGSPTSRSPPSTNAKPGTAGEDSSSLVKELSKRQQKIVEAERERLQKLKDRQYNELQRAIEMENLQAQVLLQLNHCSCALPRQCPDSPPACVVACVDMTGPATTLGANENRPRARTRGAA